MEAFQDVLDECEFKDFGFVGGKYTWYRGMGRVTQFGKDLIMQLPPRIG